MNQQDTHSGSQWCIGEMQWAYQLLAFVTCSDLLSTLVPDFNPFQRFSFNPQLELLEISFVSQRRLPLLELKMHLARPRAVAVAMFT